MSRITLWTCSCLLVNQGEKGVKGDKGEPGIGERGDKGPPGPIGNNHFSIPFIFSTDDCCVGSLGGDFNHCLRCFLIYSHLYKAIERESYPCISASQLQFRDS